MSSHSENHSRTNGSACKHPVLRVSHLWKVFKVRSGSCRRTEDLVAVDDVSFELPRSSTAAPPTSFVTYDKRLLDAAQAAGLPTDAPA